MLRKQIEANASLANVDDKFFAWRELAVFSDDWFGRTSELDGYLSKGESSSVFAGVNLDRNEFTSVTNAYQLIRSPWNNNPTPTFARFIGGGSALGAAPIVPVQYGQMSRCYALCDTFEKSRDLKTFNGEMSITPHGPVHLFTGGMSNTPGLVPLLTNLSLASDSMFDEQVLKFWSAPHILWRYGLYLCPESCSADTPLEECACTCDADALFDAGGDDDDGDDHFDDDTLVEAKRRTLAPLIAAVGVDAARALTRLLCETNVIHGEHSTSGSASDPSFWVLHGTTERYLHYAVLRGWLADLSWPISEDAAVFSSNVHPFTTKCHGHYAHDALSFGMIDGFNFTNAEYMDYVGTTANLPYVYDSFQWDHCDDYVGIDITACAPDDLGDDPTAAVLLAPQRR